MNRMAATRNRNKWARQRRRSDSSSSRSSNNATLCDDNQEIYNKNESDYSLMLGFASIGIIRKSLRGR